MAKKVVRTFERKPRKKIGRHKKNMSKSEKRNYKKYNRQGRR